MSTIAKTSQEWWNDIKQDSARFNEWLVKQYRGEVTAAVRIIEMANETESSRNKTVLKAIAEQEYTHARWVLALLESRGIQPNIDGAEERYWKTVAPAQVDFDTKCAIAAHAEGMRLERIRAIASDEDAPSDIRVTFERILVDEMWHEKAFQSMASEDALANTLPDHNEGRRVLGLVV